MLEINSSLNLKLSDAIVFFSCQDNQNKIIDSLSFDDSVKNALKKRAEEEEFTAKNGQICSIDFIDDCAKKIYLVGLGKSDQITFANIKNSIASISRTIQGSSIKEMSIICNSCLGKTNKKLGEAIALGVLLGAYRFSEYKKEKPKSSIEKCYVCFTEKLSDEDKKTFDDGLNSGCLIAKNVCFARDLVNTPTNDLYPEIFAKKAIELSEKSKGRVSVEVLDIEECKKLGMNLFLSVGQGSGREAKFIVLSWKSKKETKEKRKKICLIGKSVMYDTGGYCIKPGDYMAGMKTDMSGGASVISLFSILAETSEYDNLIDYDVYGILPSCENMVSGKATYPDDIVKAMDGTNVEIVNTDAEGRLILADSITYAKTKLEVDAIVDIATLTGSCMVALGAKYAGVFGNERALIDAFMSSSQAEGELTWELPLAEEEYAADLKSDIADIKNIWKGRFGGSIEGALFLKHFVGDTKWIHVDIAGPSNNLGGAKGITPSGGTGWGVQTFISFLQSVKI